MSVGEYLDNVLLTLDRLLAAFLGWSGKFTVSAECSASRCLVCRVVRGLLGSAHCTEAAANEERHKEKQ